MARRVNRSTATRSSLGGGSGPSSTIVALVFSPSPLQPHSTPPKTPLFLVLAVRALTVSAGSPRAVLSTGKRVQADVTDPSRNMGCLRLSWRKF